VEESRITHEEFTIVQAKAVAEDVKISLFAERRP
jgi:hypothetical protein